MEIDAAFVMGSSHKVAQDYVLTGKRPIHHVIIADGCSSSPHTDSGARLLLWSVSKELHDIHALIKDDLIKMVDRAMRHAVHNAQSLGLPPECLDATLLMLIYDRTRSRWTALVWGDGHLIARECSGRIWRIETSYVGNAPFYPSYGLNPERKNAYRAMAIKQDAPAGRTCIVTRHAPDGSTRQRRYPWHSVRFMHFPTSRFDLVMLTSDGLDSFKPLKGQGRVRSRGRGLVGDSDVLSQHDNKMSMPTAQEITRQLLDIKGYKGPFITRRLHRMVANLAKQGFAASDDLAVGAMALPQPRECKQ